MGRKEVIVFRESEKVSAGTKWVQADKRQKNIPGGVDSMFKGTEVRTSKVCTEVVSCASHRVVGVAGKQ